MVVVVHTSFVAGLSSVHTQGSAGFDFHFTPPLLVDHKHSLAAVLFDVLPNTFSSTFLSNNDSKEVYIFSLVKHYVGISV